MGDFWVLLVYIQIYIEIHAVGMRNIDIWLQPIQLLYIFAGINTLDISFQFIQIFIYIMRHRNKYDWSKPFKFIDNKKIFDQLDTNQDNTIISIAPEETKPLTPHQKEEIPVPKIDIFPRITNIKKFAKITPNYIRLQPHLNFPSENHYELTEVDHIFINNHHDKYHYKGKRVLTAEFLKKAITEMEIKAGRDMVLPRSKGWITSFIQKQYKQLLQMDKYQIFAQQAYNYWKSRREELKFPLLRSLWRPPPDDYNHMLAFRPRENNDKRNLRRGNRQIQDQIIQELYEQFNLSLKLADRIQTRQNLKFKQVQLQISAFYSQCKSIIPLPDFLDEFKIEERQKDKQTIKGFHQQLQNFKNRKESLQNIKIEQANVRQVDKKLSVVNFLASIIAQAELQGLSYERIYQNNIIDKPKQPTIVNIPFLQSSLIQEKVPEELKSPEQFLSLSLSKYENCIIRQFDEQEQHKIHVKPASNLLQYKRRKVDAYYFGSDDQGEIKDLRKNISNSFKKFQQLQQLTRVVSVTSQN